MEQQVKAQGNKVVGIGAAALAAGLTERVLRYWESKGLIESTRLSSGHRKYTKDNIRRIIEVKEFMKKHRLRTHDVNTIKEIMAELNIEKAAV